MLRLIAFAALCAVTSLALPVAAVTPACGEDTVFRCGGETVSIGDSRYTVQKICGKPSRSEPVAKSGKDKRRKPPKGTTSGAAGGKGQKWYYDRGYGDYVYVLTFSGDTLKKIEKSGRGR